MVWMLWRSAGMLGCWVAGLLMQFMDEELSRRSAQSTLSPRTKLSACSRPMTMVGQRKGIMASLSLLADQSSPCWNLHVSPSSASSPFKWDSCQVLHCPPCP